MAPLIHRRLVGWCAAALLSGSAATAQPVPDSVTVVADDRFEAGWLHRMLLGDHYRDLWSRPLRVEVLDLDRFAGGLRPLRLGGGTQTRSLRLAGADGRQYVFRSLRKFPEHVVPRELRGTFVQWVVEDQMSAMHPGGALVVPRLLQAAGVLHAIPYLRLMPDDPRLGEYRAGFAGMLGTIEERPDEGDDGAPGFAGALEVVGTTTLIERLWDRPWRQVAATNYLTARLTDLFLGDWDRHEDQWRWALLGQGDTARWYPIPRDRDQAMARYDGLLLSVARSTTPQLVNFGPSISPIPAATWNGRYLDRRLLTGLHREVWDSVAQWLTGRLTDSVIDGAIAGLPPEYRAVNGPTLRRNLRARRQRLPEAAAEFYRYLTRTPDLEASDRDDLVIIERDVVGLTHVRMTRRVDTLAYFDRWFDPRETSEIRIYLRDGDDKAVIAGEGKGPLIRLIGGDDRDTLVDHSVHRHSRFYDRGRETVAVGRGVNHRRYDRDAETDPTAHPPRDFGEQALAIPRLTVNSEVGFAAGAEYRRHVFGFRRQPYALLATGSVMASAARRSGRVHGDIRSKLVDSDTYLSFTTTLSGLDGLRWFGYGNGTTALREDEYYRVRQRSAEVGVGLGFGLESPRRLHLLLRGRYTFTDEDSPVNRDGLIGAERPLGIGTFGQLGLRVAGELDTRDHPTSARRGVLLHAQVEGYPVSTNDDRGFGSAEVEVHAFLTPGDQTTATVALRGSAGVAFGDFPYFAAALAGGRQSLAGLHRGRLSGDQAVTVGAELRLRLFRPNLLVASESGVVLLGDVGRVFSDADLNQRWRRSAGIGVWYAALDRDFTLLAGAAWAGEGTRFYLGFGQNY